MALAVVVVVVALAVVVLDDCCSCRPSSCCCCCRLLPCKLSFHILFAFYRYFPTQFLTEGDSHSKSLQVSLDSLDKSKKTYERAFKQSCTAVENFHKADADLNLSRAEVERVRTFEILMFFNAYTLACN